MSENQACAATDPSILEHEIMSWMVPKNEREWWAAHEIEHLREERTFAMNEKDEAYRQRNHLVAALARMFPSGRRPTNIQGWEPEWHNCVYIDLPAGQVSYHYHDSDAALFADLPIYTKEWDGHGKEDVHKRLSELGPAD